MNATLTIMSKITACLQFLPDPVGAREDVLLGAPAASFQVQIWSRHPHPPRLQHQLHLAQQLVKLQHVAAATAVHEQGLNDDSGLKTTREPPWQMSPLLLQEKPVLQLVPIPQFLQFLALPASFPRHLLNLGGAGW